MVTRQPPTRLFGTPSADYLYDDPATVWETDLEPYVDREGSRVIEEWTVHDPRDHLPTVEQVLEYIYEWACDSGEVAEDWGEDFPLEEPDVVAAVEALYATIASHIRYRMANEKVAEHVISWDVDGEHPLLNGEPMYVPLLQRQGPC